MSHDSSGCTIAIILLKNVKKFKDDDWRIRRQAGLSPFAENQS
jgi:hypothetical protein